MSAGLRALLTEILDYAGLFPPARLPLAEAVHCYAQYREEPEAWMLRNFICPTARLAELGELLESRQLTDPPWTVTALGRGGSGDEYRTGLRADLQEIQWFAREHSLANVNTFETRLAVANVAETVAALHETLPDAAVYLEASDGERSTMSEIVNRLSGTSPAVGLKLRCGGQTTSAVPSSEQVAFVLAACRDAAVPLKFTAGLHHPFRRYDSELRTHTHGFLNVFVAGVLAQVLRVSEEEIRAVLEDENRSNFAFDDTGLRWRERHVAVDAVPLARQRAATSFGSCSFDEPRSDLRVLGLL